jgi:integrase/recombinase XerD
VNRQCNVTKRIQTSKGPRYCPVVLSANGRIKPDVVLVGDREERHPEGAYYISWYEGKRLIRLSVGKDAATATARRLQKEAELNAVNNGVAAGDAVIAHKGKCCTKYDCTLESSSMR